MRIFSLLLLIAGVQPAGAADPTPIILIVNHKDAREVTVNLTNESTSNSEQILALGRKNKCILDLFLAARDENANGTSLRQKTQKLSPNETGAIIIAVDSKVEKDGSIKAEIKSLGNLGMFAYMMGNFPTRPEFKACDSQTLLSRLNHGLDEVALQVEKQRAYENQENSGNVAE